MYGRMLTAQQNDERRQDNDDKKRLTRHHLSDLLLSLTREWIGGGQHGIVSPALRASPFRSFHVFRVRYLMRMRIYLQLVRRQVVYASKVQLMLTYQQYFTVQLERPQYGCM